MRSLPLQFKILIFLSAGILFLFCFFLLLNFIFPLKIHIPFSTIVEDKDGNVTHAFLSRDDKWRMESEPDEISPLLRKTLIHKEDKYFKYHFGVNPVALARAAVMNVVHGKRTSGASTITMQVAKLAEPRPRTYASKIIEIFRALQLEWMFTKDEILELYFNLVPYGGNIEGIKSAAIIYLGKEPAMLSLAEATALSIIPNKPAMLTPGKKNKMIFEERNKWLTRFGKEKLFSESEIADALSEPFDAQRLAVPKNAPHFSLRMKSTATEPILKTHLDSKIQSATEKIVSDYVKSIYHNGIRNASVMVIENKTNRVVAYVGSADFSNQEDGGQVDGVRAIRQPGSALKPLLYALCFDEGIITPKSVITDVEIDIKGYRPENYDSRFNGFVSVEYSLMNSLNVPAVKLLQELGQDKLIEKLSDCNFRQISKDVKKLGLSMILGGCGVTLEEMTNLFATIAREGEYRNLVYLKNDSATNTKQILSPSAAFMVTDILSKIQRPDMPSAWEAGRAVPRIAWKTGTSYGRRDAWSIGYNKNYTIGVWVGNFSGVGAADLSGAQIATPLLFRLFNTIDKHNQNQWFFKPYACETRMVCSETGNVPNEFCTNLVWDYYIPLVSSMRKCDNMKEIPVSPDERISYCFNCMPDAGYKMALCKITPPEMQTYFEKNRIAYSKIPTHNPDCEKLFVENPPRVTSPVNGLEYLIDRNHPEPLQLSCDVTNDVKQVHWYVNNRLFKSSNSNEKIFFIPDEGKVKISCTDDKGRNTDVWIQVKYVKI